MTGRALRQPPALQVSNVPIRSGLVQRCGGRTCPPGTCDHEGIQFSLAHRGVTPSAPAVASLVRQGLQSGGRPLDSAVRARTESYFGHDFSRVRVHTDHQAASSAQGLGALAYTVGPDIVFGEQSYAPGTDTGRRLLVHELTHVAQQRVRPPSDVSDLQVESSSSSGEQAAQHVAARFAASEYWAAQLSDLTRDPALETAAGARPAWNTDAVSSVDAGRASTTSYESAPTIMRLTPEQFRKSLGSTADQKAAISALFAEKTFLSLWNYLKDCPVGPKRDLGPLRLEVTPGLKIGGKERYGGYSPLARKLEINPTKPEHVANPTELVDTITHELIHAVSDLAAECESAGANPAPLAGAATVDAPLRKDVTPAEEKQLMLELGPGASNPCEEFIDINKAAQQMIVQILRHNIKVAKVGRPTITFVNEILRRDTKAMDAYAKCRDKACKAGTPDEQSKEVAVCSASIIARFMPKALKT
jgi:hypothetical protein